MLIGPILDSVWLRQAADLFRRYAVSIADIAGPSLAAQSFEAELAALPGKYGPPGGCVYLWAQEGKAVGCIAVRPLPPWPPERPEEGASNAAELKRMFVLPEYRGRGIAGELGRAALRWAMGAGYLTVYLDTSPEMDAAIRLYRALGFEPCDRYNGDPMENTLYFRMMLAGEGVKTAGGTQ